MNRTEFLLTVVIFALSVEVTRFLPFLCFRKMEKLPPIIAYLGKVLPAAMMGLLVVYCFKGYDFTAAAEFLPAVIASACVVAVHLWRRSTVLSIALGTGVYMVLLRLFA